jgi:hypothetical protein
MGTKNYRAWRLGRVALALSFAFVLCSGERRAVMAAQSSGYHLLTKVTLGGEGGWDYLAIDSSARRLYISRWTHVVVVDADSYKVIGDIPGTEGVHGIAIAREFGRGFTSDGDADEVTIFDLKTLRKIGTVKTGKGPDGIIYDSASKRVLHSTVRREPQRRLMLPAVMSRVTWILAAIRNLPRPTGKVTSSITLKIRARLCSSTRRRSKC